MAIVPDMANLLGNIKTNLFQCFLFHFFSINYKKIFSLCFAHIRAPKLFLNSENHLNFEQLSLKCVLLFF